MRAFAVAALGAAAAVVRRRVQREYETGPEITAATAAGVWAVYLANIALVAEAAACRRMPLPLPRDASRAAGAGLTAAGTALALAAIAEFRSFRLMNGMRTDRLVTTGPYRISRHPQNVGWALALAGVAVARRSGQALAGAAAMWGSFAAYVPTEERHLRRVYGAEYERFAARTPRYLGRAR